MPDLQEQDVETKDKKDKQDEQSKEKQEEKPKPPLRRRAATWMREHPLGTLLLAVAAVVLAIATMLLWRYLDSYVSTDDAQIDGHTHQIGSRIAGTVTGVYIEDNRSVAKGQVAIDLDPRDYDTALAQAQANLSQAVAALGAQSPNVPIAQTSAATGISTARLDVTTAEAALEAAQQSHAAALADLAQAQAAADNATAEERRYRPLAQKEEVSREAYDQRATEARTRAAQVAARQAAADAAAKTVSQRSDAVSQARDRYREEQSNQPRQVAVQHAALAGRQAAVEAARSQLEQARLNRSYCKILAPVAGIVGSKTVEVGQQVAPGQELFAITAIDDLWITANFKETQIARLQPGQAVTVYVDALAQKFNGHIENLPGATGARYSLLPPENATGNYVKVVQRLPIRIRLEPGQPGMERLRPGMSVEPKVWVNSHGGQ